jgi:uncharacterized protein YbjT (DUF2867 family)
MRILVTGASGFVGAMLAPRLLGDGHRVRALARDPARATDALAAVSLAGGFASAPSHPPAAVEVVRGDVLTGAGLRRALEGVEVAYYLIHSMESRAPSAARATAFPERERLGATTFAEAAQQAGVRRIVYLGGLLPQGPAATSPHLASRDEVQRILFEHVPESVALRAAIVIGARSRSFRLMVRLIERLPVLVLPPWRRFRTRPIDARDVLEMLVTAAREPAVAGRALDIGGPETLTYEALLQRLAESLLVHRPTVTVGVGLTRLTARLAAALSDEDAELTAALMDGLQSDLLPSAEDSADLLGVRLHPLDAAIEHALREWEAVEPLAAR